MYHSNFRVLKFLRRLFGCCHMMGARLSRKHQKLIELSDHEINLLELSTGMSKEQILDFHANFLEDCPNGYLTKKDFIRMFKVLHPDDVKREKCDKFAEYVFK